MERETKTIKVGEKELVVKTFATARESHKIQEAYFKGAKIEMVGDQPKMSDFNPSVEFEVEKEMIRQLVVSFDGSEENIIERTENLPVEQYNEIVKVLDELVSKKKKTTGQ